MADAVTTSTAGCASTPNAARDDMTAKPSLFYSASSGMAAPAPAPAQTTREGRTPPTDYGAVVVALVGKMTRETGAIDQNQIRHALALAASHLLADTATDAERGGARWAAGLHRLVDILVALHARDELELATVNEASRACAECWSVAGAWRGLEPCRDGVRGAAAKLKTLLDANGRTFRGNRVYAP
jgi:hypothetical protein